MFNTALHREMLHGMKDYGFDVTLNGFDWKYVIIVILFISYYFLILISIKWFLILSFMHVWTKLNV